MGAEATAPPGQAGAPRPSRDEGFDVGGRRARIAVCSETRPRPAERRKELDRVIGAAACVALAFCAADGQGRGLLHAREPRPALAALQGVGPPVPRDRGTWYGWQTLIADATAGALALVGATPRNDAALTAASALYLLGGPAMQRRRAHGRERVVPARRSGHALEPTSARTWIRQPRAARGLPAQPGARIRVGW